MTGNSFGNIFKITTCGESHGGAVGVIVDGCPAGLEISNTDIQHELDRRKPGQSNITTSRNENDKIHIYSGVFEGKTTGTPILLLSYNKDMRPEDYENTKNLYRPSHADYTYMQKYGRRDFRGSGRSSARETLARVAAGAIAQKYLKKFLNIEIFSYTQQVGDIKTNIDYKNINRKTIESNIVRCPDSDVASKMIKLIEKIKESGDSIGGVIKGIIKNVPAGIGEPVFDKLSADLGKAMLSINAVKGFEIGSGFQCSNMLGSEHNDIFILNEDNISTKTNHAGGIIGGISTGEDIFFSVVFKPVSTILKSQQTLSTSNDIVNYKPMGRHDPCVLPRAVPIIDAMSALVIMDHFLRQKVRS
ncbi:chorismate synthase [Gammaproteobacteria bacterium]|nr:chorismate synthase [Gammaproteobacteria bacterium]